MTDEKQAYLPWNEGQPTKPDVDSLLKAFPVENMTPGWRVTDEAVRAVVGDLHGARYRTVYAAWVRRLLKDHGINLFRENTIGFFVPTAEEVFSRTHPALQHIGRTAKKQIRHIAVVRAENDLQKTTQDHQGRLLHSISREAKKARMNVLPPTSAAPMPQIVPPAS